jgi:hypothetical protein
MYELVSLLVCDPCITPWMHICILMLAMCVPALIFHVHGFHVVLFIILPLRICEYLSHVLVSASASALCISFIFSSWGPHAAITMRVARIVTFYACLTLLSLDGDGYLISICRQQAAAFVMQCLAWTYWAYVS